MKQRLAEEIYFVVDELRRLRSYVASCDHRRALLIIGEDESTGFWLEYARRGISNLEEYLERITR